MANKKRSGAMSQADESLTTIGMARRSAVSIAVATALTGAMMMPISAYAQDAADDEEVIEEIITTGYRSSLMNSIATKRDSSSIVEAISAEDIGKLPDASIGESLARLPGLAAQRFDGRANRISIRGLAPDFTTVMLNGREMVSSDDNRAVEYDQFPSELITGATVYKTPDASLTAQAVGGTVDMQTVRPLNYKEPVLAVGLRGEIADEGKLNPDTDDFGYRANIAYIGQNDAGTVGYAFGYSRMTQPIQEKFIHGWGYENFGDGDDRQFISGLKPFVKSNELTRDGILGVIEFAPSDELRARVDLFYSKFDDEQTLRGVEIAGYTREDRTIEQDSNNIVTQGTWEGLYTMPRNDFSDRNVETRSIGFNVVYDMNEDWRLEGDVSWSDAERDYVASEVYLSDGRGQSGSSADYSYTLGAGNGVLLSSPDADFSDPNQWMLGDNLGWGGGLCSGDSDPAWAYCDSQDGFRNSASSTDEMNAIALAAERLIDSGFVNNIKFGARYAVRDKGHVKRGHFLTLDDYPNLADIPQEHIVGTTSLDFIGLGDLVSFDSRAIASSGIYGLYPENVTTAIGADDWTVEEDVMNLFAMAEFETDNWSGNFGLQAVYTDQQSTGIQAGTTSDGLTFDLVTEGADFWEILPSFNGSYHIDDNKKVRVGLARILARPQMTQMRANKSFSFNEQNIDATEIEDSPWGGSGGNAALEPWMAWQLDLSFETYFADAGYAALTIFHKELENYVYNKQVLTDFSSISALLPPGLQPVLDEGYVSAPDNGDGGWIRGIEFSTSIPFDVMSDSLRDFGAYVSASYTDSEVKETPDSDPTELPGLSEMVINGTFYYENDAGFQARISARYRDKYLADAYQIGLSRELTIAKEETIVDAQLSLDLTDFVNWGDGITLYLQGSNLTDEPFIQYFNNNPTQFRNYHAYGRSYMFGFTYRR